MIRRQTRLDVENALMHEAAVALIGPRQVGKTTLALEIAENRPSIYVDLENPVDRAKLNDPLAFLTLYQDKLVILDEIHRLPDIFNILRGVIDQGRRDGRGLGRFLLLGSASIDLMRQSETLAGRIAYVDMGPIHAQEIRGIHDVHTLWRRGGFPRSLLAETDTISFERRINFIRTYLERDIPMFGARIPAETLQRLWTMLAHHQGGLLNVAQLAGNFGVSSPTITSYINLLNDLLLVRRLMPYHANIGKRLVKSPKVYVRDSGLVHALLGIETMEDLLGHPVIGASWEGFVIETILAAAPKQTRATFYRTAGGAEVDLILEMGAKHGTWAVEVKRGHAPKITRSLRSGLDAIQPDHAFIVYGGDDSFPLGAGIQALSLENMILKLSQLHTNM